MILADAYDAFLLDLDGVVWRGEEPIDGADETIAELRSRGRTVVFASNNSARTPRDYAMKLARMKIPTPNDEIVTSGHAVIAELRRLELRAGDTVHVLGSEGLTRMLTHERFVPTADEDRSAKAVVVGWNRRCTYEDIRRASNLVRAGIPFIAANRDATYPDESGLLPGTGAILAAIEVASGRTATVTGKPEPALFHLALERAGVGPGRALFVGDRPDTDLIGARAAGIACALALSGIATERDLGSLPVLPDHILDSVRDLVRDLPAPEIRTETGELVAVDGSELARLRAGRTGTTVVLGELRAPRHLGPDGSWRVVRRLLAEAVWGADRVDAAPDLRAYLQRIGIDGDPQGTLFTP